MKEVSEADAHSKTMDEYNWNTIPHFKGPRTYLARVSKEVKFHFRSTEFPQ